MAGQRLISVIIPVLREGRQINTAVRRIKAGSRRDGIEIIVVDGDPDRSTIRYIEDKDVKKIVASPGRAAQMNAGAQNAKGDILVFLHCDTILPQNGFKIIIRVLDRDQYHIGAFDLSINAKGFCYRLIERSASIRSRLTRIPYGDQAFFMKKHFFFEMGAYKEIPLMEDVEFMQRVKKAGKKLYICRETVKTSARRWQKEGVLYGTLRNWTIMGMYLLGVPPGKLANVYKPNKEK